MGEHVNCRICGSSFKPTKHQKIYMNKTGRIPMCSRSCFRNEISQRQNGCKHFMFGKKHTKEARNKMSKLRLKDGTCSHLGYVRVRGRDGIKRELHREVMEQHLCRKLLSSEIVHHIDEDRTNNSIDNLRLVSRREHNLIHQENRRQKKTMEGVYA